MKGRPKDFDDMPSAMDFRDAKANFMKAAKHGASSMMKWRGECLPLRELLAGEFMDIAREGLKKTTVDQAEVDYYLGIIERRIKGQTAAEWMIEHYRKLQDEMKSSDALIALTQTIHMHQREGEILEKWPKQLKADAFPSSAKKLGHIMSTNLVSLSPKDNAELSLRLMKWRDIHHLPVVNENNHLVGILTMNHLRQYWDELENSEQTLLVEDIMVKNVLSGNSHTDISEAIALMKRNEIGCLPVVKK